jgi:hypothetical protein
MDMLRRTALRSCIVLAVAGGNLLAVPAVAIGEAPKWFVLRRSEIANCWTALLVRIDGAYRHDSAQIAGGPYDTEAAAQDRETELERTGTCTKL